MNLALSMYGQFLVHMEESGGLRVCFVAAPREREIRGFGKRVQREFLVITEGVMDLASPAGSDSEVTSGDRSRLGGTP